MNEMNRAELQKELETLIIQGAALMNDNGAVAKYIERRRRSVELALKEPGR